MRMRELPRCTPPVMTPTTPCFAASCSGRGSGESKTRSRMPPRKCSCQARGARVRVPPTAGGADVAATAVGEVRVAAPAEKTRRRAKTTRTRTSKVRTLASLVPSPRMLPATRQPGKQSTVSLPKPECRTKSGACMCSRGATL
eukprot:Rmarinus@m.25019